MYRTVEDFIADWKVNADGTLRTINTLSDESLQVSIVEGHNSLGWLAWHLVSSIGFFCSTVGLNVPKIDPKAPVPTSVQEIAAKYDELAKAVVEQASTLSDEDIVAEVNSFAGPIARGKFLRTFIDHQTHHRGQMTVLIRQAGLVPPALLGPTKEMSKF